MKAQASTCLCGRGRASFVPLSAFGTASQAGVRVEGGGGRQLDTLECHSMAAQVGSKCSRRAALQPTGQNEFSARCKLDEIFIIFLARLLISCAFSFQMHWQRATGMARARAGRADCALLI